MTLKNLGIATKIVVINVTLLFILISTNIVFTLFFINFTTYLAFEDSTTLFIINLKPRKMMGEMSEGMLFDIGYPDGIIPVLAIR